MSFPDNCIKGIPNEDFMVNGSFGSHLFTFDKKHTRDDGWIEQSINWEDDDSAIMFTLKQTRENGEKQFKVGVVIIPRDEIDRLKNRPTVRGILSYERQPLENNRYHGNILLRANVSSHIMRRMAAGLALAVSKFILQPKTN